MTPYHLDPNQLERHLQERSYTRVSTVSLCGLFVSTSAGCPYIQLSAFVKTCSIAKDFCFIQIDALLSCGVDAVKIVKILMLLKLLRWLLQRLHYLLDLFLPVVVLVLS